MAKNLGNLSKYIKILDKKTPFQKVAERTSRLTKPLEKFERLRIDSQAQNEEMFKVMDEVNQRKREEKAEEKADRKKSIDLQQKTHKQNIILIYLGTAAIIVAVIIALWLKQP